MAALFSSPDARHVALINIGALSTAVTMVLNPLAIGARSSPDPVREVFGITGDLQVASEVLEKFIRIAFITQVQFQVENLLANLRRADGGRTLRGYERIVRESLQRFGYPAPGRGLRVMMVPAHIRNSLHNNGIHENADFRVQINGFEFRFRQGHRYTQAGWGHIVHALRAELRVLERLLLTTRVRRMTYVPERYAQAIGVRP